jgi:hypothetical protein
MRLVIPKMGIDAPVTVKGLDASGAMQNPNGPEDVAWYDFTARPGQGGNTVFSATWTITTTARPSSPGYGR